MKPVSIACSCALRTWLRNTFYSHTQQKSIIKTSLTAESDIVEPRRAAVSRRSPCLLCASESIASSASLRASASRCQPLRSTLRKSNHRSPRAGPCRAPTRRTNPSQHQGLPKGKPHLLPAAALSHLPLSTWGVHLEATGESCLQQIEVCAVRVYIEIVRLNPRCTPGSRNLELKPRNGK